MEKIIGKIQEFGAFKVGTVLVKDIATDSEFRTLCEQNYCGNYGRCHTCPPFVGEFDALVDIMKSYHYAIVYQTVGNLEDSYDFEGMVDASKITSDLSQAISNWLKAEGYSDFLHLGAGGCRVCERCSKITDELCRFPDRAMASLEAYGINVSELAKSSDMNYINGKDTVTYFGTVFLRK